MAARRVPALLALVLLASACGDDGSSPDTPDAMPRDGGPPGFTIGGEVRCLHGSGLVLRTNGMELPITQSGAFEFPTLVPDGTVYEVTIVGEPSSPAQDCVVDDSVGTIRNESVTDVVVRCSGAPTSRVAFHTYAGDSGRMWLGTLDELDCPGLEPINVGPSFVPRASQVSFSAEDSRLVFDGAVVDGHSSLAVVDVTAQDFATNPLGEHVLGFELSPDGSRAIVQQREFAWTGYYVAVADLSSWPPVIQPASDELWDLGVPAWSSNGEAVVFLAAFAETDPRSAMLVDLSGTGPYTTVQLNPPLASNRDVKHVVIAPDATRAAYVADQDIDETVEVYLVGLGAVPETPTKISPPVQAGSYAWVNEFTPDGNALVFTVLAPDFTDGDLFWIDLTGPGIGAPVQVDVSGDVSSPRVSPDGRWLAYWANHAVPGPELFLVDISGPVPDAPVRISPEDAQSTGYGSPHAIWFTSDSRWILFRADENGFTAGPNAFAVDVSSSTPSAPYPISPTLTDEILGEIAVAPDGSRALCAYGEVQGQTRLSVVDLSGPTPGPVLEIPADGSVITQAFTRDGDALLFTTRARPDVTNLLVVHLENEVVGTAQQVNLPFGPQDGNVGAFDTMPLP
jgi:dipeptidyl aminopeptidase/acylaminoacyl peptidase